MNYMRKQSLIFFVKLEEASLSWQDVALATCLSSSSSSTPCNQPLPIPPVGSPLIKSTRAASVVLLAITLNGSWPQCRWSVLENLSLLSKSYMNSKRGLRVPCRYPIIVQISYYRWNQEAEHYTLAS